MHAGSGACWLKRGDRPSPGSRIRPTIPGCSRTVYNDTRPSPSDIGRETPHRPGDTTTVRRADPRNGHAEGDVTAWWQHPQLHDMFSVNRWSRTTTVARIRGPRRTLSRISAPAHT